MKSLMKFTTQYFPKQMDMLPKDGATVKVGKDKLKWHALDSKLFYSGLLP